MRYKVLITTSGTGSRLGPLTKTTNKALLPIAGKPAIDHILSQYDPDVECVITLGYLADQVRTMLIKNHPEHIFTFVTVDPFEGPGSSLGYSMMAARDMLQTPFVFHSCDTIVTDPIPMPDHNWVAGYHLAGDVSHYTTHRTDNGRLLQIQPKGAATFDTIHIGISGIVDFPSFWENLDRLYREHPEDATLNDTAVINEMLKEGKNFTMIPFSTWYDTGNLEALAATERVLNRQNQ